MHSHTIAFIDTRIDRAVAGKLWSVAEALMNRRLEYIRLEAAYEMRA
jgi:hypothetical protein